MAKQLKEQGNRVHVVPSHTHYDPERYSHDELINPAGLPFQSTKEMVEAAAKKEISVEGIVLARMGESIRKVRINTEKFVSYFKEGNEYKKRVRFREFDSFGGDGSFSGSSPDLVGRDFVPLLGGPFNKQLYLQQYLESQAQCFYAIHHDPIARATVQITRDFTLGRSFKVVASTKAGQALWNAFEKANRLQERMQAASLEMSAYGELMWWWLPNQETKMVFNVTPEGQLPPTSIIPRVRLIDPSTCWEIVTFPEDIERILNYTLVFPTQYQLYSADYNGEQVPSSKWIYQQIPASQIDHYKVNVVSNEKRGRSDLFPVLGYLKRMRDTVDAEILRLQKQGSWAIDTMVDGNDDDLKLYAQSQRALGTIPPAGSEFIHSKKVVRQMLESGGGGSAMNNAFEWNLSMIAMGAGIPIAWYGTHLSGQGTRAGQFTSTEPVIKKMENRREVYRRMIVDMGTRLFRLFNIRDEVDVTFPELVVQDRTAKMKDLALAVAEGWLSQERAAKIAAKELGINDFDWEEEKAKVIKNPALIPPSLSTPGRQGNDETRGASGEDRADEQGRSNAL